MFSKSNERITSRVDTIIGKNFIYKGNLEAKEGSLRVDGQFQGEINIGGNLFIGETGEIEGIINANNITISGKVNGKIIAKGKMELNHSARVFADVKMANLAIEDGAIFQGQCEPHTQDSLKKKTNEKLIETNNTKNSIEVD